MRSFSWCGFFKKHTYVGISFAQNKNEKKTAAVRTNFEQKMKEKATTTKNPSIFSLTNLINW